MVSGLLITAAAPSGVAAALATAAAATAHALDSPSPSGADGTPPANTIWTDVTALGILGRGWPSEAMTSPFSRLPAAAQATLCGTAKCAANCSVPSCEAYRCAVWGLRQTATGLHVKF